MVSSGGFLRAQTADSTLHKTAVHLWYPVYLPLPQDSGQIHIRLTSPHAQKMLPKINFFSGQFMTSDPFKLDYREGSYYVPAAVQNEIARGMNRPSPGSFMPVLTVAYLAARLAMHYISIQEKIRITALDYLNNERYLPILKLLWKKSPQTVYDLYKHRELQKTYTLRLLKKAMNDLINDKLVKIRRRAAGEAPLFYAAQTAPQALITLQNGLDDIPLTEQQRTQLAALIAQVKDL